MKLKSIMKSMPSGSMPGCQAREQSGQRGQRGVTLIVVMLVLLVVTVLALGGAQIATLGEKGSRYDRDYLIASQAAEAALMDAEFDIRGPNSAGSTVKRVTSFTREKYGMFVDGCGTTAANRGMCLPVSDSAKPLWASVDFLDESASAPTVAFGTYTGRAFDAGSAGVKPAKAPRYLIELIEDVEPGTNASASARAGLKRKMYRITSIGFGPRVDIQVVMQIAFRKEKG